MCFSRNFTGLFGVFTVYFGYKNKEVNTMNKAYAKHKLALLIRDHNHYVKVRYTDAVKDYRTAIDMLVATAKRQGIKMSYKVTADGYIM